MENETNRKCQFVSYVTYIDKNGELFQFAADNTTKLSLTNELVKADCEEVWSDIWYICKIDDLNKTIAEVRGEDWELLKTKHSKDRDSIMKFVDWFKNKY